MEKMVKVLQIAWFIQNLLFGPNHFEIFNLQMDNFRSKKLNENRSCLILDKIVLMSFLMYLVVYMDEHERTFEFPTIWRLFLLE
jgi:hypothetical protein